MIHFAAIQWSHQIVWFYLFLSVFLAPLFVIGFLMLFWDGFRNRQVSGFGIFLMGPTLLFALAVGVAEVATAVGRPFSARTAAANLELLLDDPTLEGIETYAMDGPNAMDGTNWCTISRDDYASAEALVAATEDIQDLYDAIDRRRAALDAAGWGTSIREVSDGRTIRSELSASNGDSDLRLSVTRVELTGEPTRFDARSFHRCEFP